ncbi:cell division protein ZapA [Pseudothioclava arenosa]|uniref:Cell division protein ZapA n=1 Tax=Pseudothioclava arenosa TaxID=1795308 RepID=A0A2A4CTK8_9RHOB|nr:cell division protein ZapA [Pseudothioclava arenosa]PCD77690.1 cell division protein ZapA [Pseudothioclava arenosa]
MPEITISIGGRNFSVACQAGEEHFLHAAAGMLDTEAQTLLSQIGRIPESRMLLMAGLMLADKTAGVEDQIRAAEARILELEAQLRDARENRPHLEVPVVPQEVTDTLAELAARAESLADKIEERG